MATSMPVPSAPTFVADHSLCWLVLVNWTQVRDTGEERRGEERRGEERTSVEKSLHKIQL